MAHDHNEHGREHDGRSFDERAQDWDDEDKAERARVVAAAIRQQVPLDDTTRVFEYGAGTGLATQFLAAGPIGGVTLADPSTGMREVMAEKVGDGRLPADAQIVDIDLATGDLPDERFDLAVTVMALHHVEDPAPVLAGFASLLVDGGHLCVVDLEAEDGSFHDDPEILHHGFQRDELRDWLAAAGFTDVTFGDVHEIVKNDRPYPLFLATARRPAD